MLSWLQAASVGAPAPLLRHRETSLAVLLPEPSHDHPVEPLQHLHPQTGLLCKGAQAPAAAVSLLLKVQLVRAGALMEKLPKLMAMVLLHLRSLSCSAGKPEPLSLQLQQPAPH